MIEDGEIFFDEDSKTYKIINKNPKKGMPRNIEFIGKPNTKKVAEFIIEQCIKNKSLYT